jgi:hypothetical protein
MLLPSVLVVALVLSTTLMLLHLVLLAQLTTLHKHLQLTHRLVWLSLLLLNKRLRFRLPSNPEWLLRNPVQRVNKVRVVLVVRGVLLLLRRLAKHSGNNLLTHANRLSSCSALQHCLSVVQWLVTVCRLKNAS